jgi:hypothetical protein
MARPGRGGNWRPAQALPVQASGNVAGIGCDHVLTGGEDSVSPDQSKCRHGKRPKLMFRVRAFLQNFCRFGSISAFQKSL